MYFLTSTIRRLAALPPGRCHAWSAAPTQSAAIVATGAVAGCCRTTRGGEERRVGRELVREREREIEREVDFWGF